MYILFYCVSAIEYLSEHSREPGLECNTENKQSYNVVVVVVDICILCYIVYIFEEVKTRETSQIIKKVKESNREVTIQVKSMTEKTELKIE